jgi:Zn-dependent alcohol dehydrogenase
METKAAVVREVGQLAVETVQLEPPGPGEILVRLRAAGVCHSDLHTYRGELRTAPPLVLGHEGAGIVEQVGTGVTRVKPGDAILVNWLPACGSCLYCLGGRPFLCERLAETTFKGLLPAGTSRLATSDGLRLKHYLSAATMAERAVIGEESAVAIPADMPFEVAAIIGCAVATGVGAVINTARVRPGSSAAVFGCGGVGLSAILGLRLAGCHPIVAVDLLDAKLAFARELGATDTVNAQQVDAVAALRAISGRGPAYVFDSVGAAATISQALRAVAPGGTVVVMGLHAAKIDVPIPAGTLIFQNKHLIGSFAGSIRPHIDLPWLVEAYRSGLLPVDRLITKCYRLDEVGQAFDDMESGGIGRAAIVFDH